METINEIADEALKISRARADKMQCEYPENIEGVKQNVSAGRNYRAAVHKHGCEEKQGLIWLLIIFPFYKLVKLIKNVLRR